MNTQNISRYGVLFAVVFCAFLTSAPSNTSAAAELFPDSQSAEEIALLEDLVIWVEGEAETTPLTSTPLTLREAIHERSASFEVFRHFPGSEARSAQLAGVPYAASIRATAERHGVDALLLAAIVEAESSFNPRAVSHRGAVGLMQVMPASAGATSPESLVEPDANLDAGARYLRSLLERFGGDLELTLAAYNAGPTNVRRYGGVPPFRETRNYVERVLGIYVARTREVWQESAAAVALSEV
jgi:hypothetical protein